MSGDRETLARILRQIRSELRALLLNASTADELLDALCDSVDSYTEPVSVNTELILRVVLQEGVRRAQEIVRECNDRHSYVSGCPLHTFDPSFTSFPRRNDKRGPYVYKNGKIVVDASGKFIDDDHD